MKLLGRLSPNVVEVAAEEVREGQRLAAGRYQPFSLANVDASGEIVLEAGPGDDGLIYIVGCAAPDYAWTLEPQDAVMIEKES